MSKVMRILLVDDDKDEYILTQELLTDRSLRAHMGESVSYLLDWASSYSAALDAYENTEYDALLVDYHLGEQNGLQLTRELVRRGCKAPIILMTGQGSYAVDFEAMKVGVTDYLVKSEVTAALLERTIRYALEQKITAEKIRQNAERIRMLAELSRSFAEAGLSYPDVIEVIAKQIAAFLKENTLIWLLSEDGNSLELAARAHPDPENQNFLSASPITGRKMIDDSLLGVVFQTGHAAIFPERVDQTQSPEFSELWRPYSNAGVYQALMAPLHAEGQVVGMLMILRCDESSLFSNDDQVFFEDLGNRAALAIENARLYRVETRRVRELDALHSATAILLSTIELQALPAKILEAAQSAIPAAERGIFLLMETDSNEVHIWETTKQAEGVSNIQDRQIAKHSEQALAFHEPLLVHDVATELPDFPSVLQIDEKLIRSAIIAPLLWSSEMFGLISLASSGLRAFKRDDLRLMESIATTTTAALQNAILHAKIQKLAVTDSLTGTLNRRGFFDAGLREVERSLRFNRPLSVIMVDIDNFKGINDTYGHIVGDHVLRIAAERLHSSIREVDYLGRYGGDEFILLLPETDIILAGIVAERIRLRISEPIQVMDTTQTTRTIIATASLGVTSLQAGSASIERLLDCADQAAYQAKHSGRDRVIIM